MEDASICAVAQTRASLEYTTSAEMIAESLLSEISASFAPVLYERGKLTPEVQRALMLALLREYGPSTSAQACARSMGRMLPSESARILRNLKRDGRVVASGTRSRPVYTLGS